MKVEVKTTSPKFAPIKLEVTIENERDLMMLWHRLNFGDFSSGYLESYKVPRASAVLSTGPCMQLFNTLDEIRSERCISKNGDHTAE